MLGFDPEAVNLTLAETERQLSEAVAVNKELRLQINSLREQNTEWGNRLKHYEQIETDLREALLSTQRIANQVKEDAEKESEELLLSARNKSEEMLEEATRVSESKELEVETIIAEKRIEILQLEEQIQSLSEQKRELQTIVDQAMPYFAKVHDLITSSKINAQNNE
jgi:cell division initiation protein